MSESENIQPITLGDLATTRRTLLAMAGNYRIGSTGNSTLIDARRLVEIEVRQQHGDKAREALCAEE